MSRASTLYASAFQTERKHELRIRKGAQREIVIDLNGLLDAGASISSVTWDTSGQSCATIGSPSASGRTFTANLLGVCEGNGEIEARVTLSDGSVSVQRIAVWVK